MFNAATVLTKKIEHRGGLYLVLLFYCDCTKQLKKKEIVLQIRHSHRNQLCSPSFRHVPLS